MVIKDNFNLKKTADGSFSLFSKEFNELMHAREGAYKESLIKHVYPSKILELKKEVINILDIGFGVGYNILALLNEFKRTDSYLNIISLEKNKTAFPFLKGIKFMDNRKKIYEKIIKSFSKGIYIDKRFKIQVLFGDARSSLINLLNERVIFDGVFHDPFSPAKNPELWTTQYFELLKKLITKTAIVSTYSSACQIRSAMYAAGLKVFKIDSMGKKKEGTLASKETISGYEEIDYKALLLNKKSVPYKDPDFSLNRDDILKNRLQEIKNNK